MTLDVSSLPGRLDATAVLPPALSRTDCAALLSRCPLLHSHSQPQAQSQGRSNKQAAASAQAPPDASSPGAGHVFAGTLLVSDALLQVTATDSYFQCRLHTATLGGLV